MALLALSLRLALFLADPFSKIGGQVFIVALKYYFHLLGRCKSLKMLVGIIGQLSNGSINR